MNNGATNQSSQLASNPPNARTCLDGNRPATPFYSVPPHLLDLFESFHTLSRVVALTLKTIGDGDGKIFSARSGWAESGASVAVVLGDCNSFGSGLLWLGFHPSTLVGPQHLWRDGQCSSSYGCGLPPQAFSVVEAFSAEARFLCSFDFLGGCLVLISCVIGQLFSMLNHWMTFYLNSFTTLLLVYCILI
jgi:hypothetical protein